MNRDSHDLDLKNVDHIWLTRADWLKYEIPKLKGESKTTTKKQEVTKQKKKTKPKESEGRMTKEEE